MTLSIRVAELPEDVDTLLALGERIYADDPAWVEPLRMIERRQLDPDKNAFFRHAELVLFFAERDGEVVGSISVLKDKRFKSEADKRVIYWGYFECIDDAEVADALFVAAKHQAREWDATHLRGPKNLTSMEYVGLTISAFDRRPPMLQGHHKSYYAGFVEAAGFTKHHDHFAYEADLFLEDGEPREVPEGLTTKAASCRIEGLEVRSARWRTMRHDLIAAHEVYNAAYVTVPDVPSMPLATWMTLGRTYLGFMSVELLQLAFVKDEPVGFAVCIPEINNALAAAHGVILPTGWVRFITAWKQEKTAGFKLIGVVPEYRGSGLHAVLIKNILEGLQRARYTRVDGSIIDERNKPMRAVVEHAGMDLWKTYRVYDLEL